MNVIISITMHGCIDAGTLRSRSRLLGVHTRAVVFLIIHSIIIIPIFNIAIHILIVSKV